MRKYEYFRSCSRCGARNHKRSFIIAPVDVGANSWVVKCSFCGHTGRSMESRDGAVRVWNEEEGPRREEGKVS